MKTTEENALYLNYIKLSDDIKRNGTEYLNLCNDLKLISSEITNFLVKKFNISTDIILSVVSMKSIDFSLKNKNLDMSLFQEVEDYLNMLCRSKNETKEISEEEKENKVLFLNKTLN